MTYNRVRVLYPYLCFLAEDDYDYDNLLGWQTIMPKQKSWRATKWSRGHGFLDGWPGLFPWSFSQHMASEFLIHLSQWCVHGRKTAALPHIHTQLSLLPLQNQTWSWFSHSLVCQNITYYWHLSKLSIKKY